MNIAAALSHFEWKFKNHWKPTKKDLEAYNSILEWKEIIESKNLSQNESLAKLWIHQFLLLAWAQKLDSNNAIKEIDGILSRSVYEWVLVLKKDIPLLKLHLKDLNETSTDKLLDNFLKVPDDDNLIKFVSDQITRVIVNFEK